MRPDFIRQWLGIVIIVVGICMCIIGFRWRHELWAGVQTKEVVKEVTVVKEALRVGVRVGPGPGQFYTGALKIENRYETTNNHLPSGDYQVLDENNTIWMLKLCQAHNNGVLPDFPVSRVVDILYTKGDNCYDFVSAQMIKQEGEK